MEKWYKNISSVNLKIKAKVRIKKYLFGIKSRIAIWEALILGETQTVFPLEDKGREYL